MTLSDKVADLLMDGIRWVEDYQVDKVTEERSFWKHNIQLVMYKFQGSWFRYFELKFRSLNVGTVEEFETLWRRMNTGGEGDEVWKLKRIGPWLYGLDCECTITYFDDGFWVWSSDTVNVMLTSGDGHWFRKDN